MKIKQSRFRLTRKVIATQASQCAADGDSIGAMKLNALLENVQPPQNTPNQRQRRKARRARWAAGDRRAFV